MTITTRTGFALTTAPGDPVESGGPYAWLLLHDPVLRRLARDCGRPDPFTWDVGDRTGTSNFAALLLHIAGQQISTAVAFVLFDRLRSALGRVPDPIGVESLGVERLRSFGFSQAKAQYMFGLAQMQLAGSIDVDGLDPLDDERAIAALTAVRGIGRWSAEMFLIHQLHRPDVLPAGDLGIRRAVAAGWGLPGLPTVDQVGELARPWSPYRAYAAALLWASREPCGPSHLERSKS